MIVSARGPRRNRIWGVMQPRLGRGTFARGSGFAKGQWGTVRRQANHTRPAWRGGRGVGLRFQNTGAVQLVNWYSKI